MHTLLRHTPKDRDGSGQNPTRGLIGHPDPTRATFSRTRVTRSNFFWEILLIFCQIQPKLTEKCKKNWPELDPNQISLTRNPTRAKSKNPKPDPRAEKLTRPTPTTSSYVLSRKKSSRAIDYSTLALPFFFLRTFRWVGKNGDGWTGNWRELHKCISICRETSKCMCGKLDSIVVFW